MVYVTHDQVEAMTLANKIVVLQSGLIEQVGTPLDLFDDPDNQFVAGFIGAPKMNFVPAIVSELSEAGVTVTLPSLGSAQLTKKLETRSLAKDQKITLGIRPEHFAFEASPGAQVKLQCELVEQLGDIAYRYAVSESGERLIIGLRDDRSSREGDNFETFIPSERAFLFDEHGGRIR